MLRSRKVNIFYWLLSNPGIDKIDGVRPQNMFIGGYENLEVIKSDNLTNNNGDPVSFSFFV